MTTSRHNLNGNYKSHKSPVCSHAAKFLPQEIKDFHTYFEEMKIFSQELRKNLKCILPSITLRVYLHVNLKTTFKRQGLLGERWGAESSAITISVLYIFRCIQSLECICNSQTTIIPATKIFAEVAENFNYLTLFQVR